LNPPDIYSFVVLKDGVTDSDDALITDVKQLVRKHIGGFAVPEIILVCNNDFSEGIFSPPSYTPEHYRWFLDCLRLVQERLCVVF
jgi:hypothetical protein